MKRGSLVVVLLIILVSIFGITYHNAHKDNITGNPVFLDDGFTKPASSFGAGPNQNQASLSPGGCSIENISFDYHSINIGSKVNILVEGNNCDGQQIEVELFEDDLFFDDYLGTINATFVENRASIEWFVSSETYSYLFDEIFEGKRLEFYTQINLNNVKSFSSIIYALKGEGPFLQPVSNYVGKGCTTVWYIDEDCDGYGVGKQSGGQYGRVATDIYGDMPDADDMNPNVNTPQSLIQQFGDPAVDLNNLKNFLVSRGYNTPANIYFISLNGDDSSGQVNDITRPFRSFGSVRFRLRANDFVIYRGGYYIDPQGVLRLGSGSVVPKGTPGNPIVIMSYPGENVVFDSYASIGFSAGVENIVIDGFIATCELGGCSSNGIGEQGVNILGSANNFVLRNLEVLRHRWGIWGGTPKNNVTIESSVVHDNSNEHGIYIPNSDTNPMTNFVIQNNLVYRNRRTGIQLNGKMDGFIIKGNVIHSNALNGLTFTNGVQNSIVENNLIMNNDKQGIVIFSYCDSAYFTCTNTDPRGCLVGLTPECSQGQVCNRAAYPECYGDGAAYRQSNDNNQFINNLIWVGSDWNGVCENEWSAPSCIHSSPYDFPAVELADNTPRNVYTFTNNDFRNNIFQTNGAPVFKTDKLDHLLSPGTLIENNLFFRNSGEPAGLGSETTDGSHSSTFQIVNTVYYAWTLSELQNHWPSLIRNNIQSNPAFTDSLLNYALTPDLFNFDPTMNSPTRDNGVSTNAPQLDLHGRQRDNLPDIGSYEYLGVGGPQITSINPNSILNTQNNLVTIRGNNFVSSGEIELCLQSTCNIVGNPSFISSQELQYTFNANSLAQGNYLLYIINPGPVRSNPLPFTVTSSTVPNAPSNLNGQALSSSSVSLSWTDNSNNEDRFVIEQKLSSSSTWSTSTGANNLPPGTTSFTLTNLNVGTYDFRVFAENNAGRSTPSNVLRLSTFSNPPTLTSLNPSTIVNNIFNQVLINGNNFDPLDLLVNGVVIPRELWTLINSSSINLNVIPGLIVGYYNLSVKNVDNTISNTGTLRINYPFNYLLTLSNSTVLISPGNNFDLNINIQSIDFMTHEPVTLVVTSSPGITVGFNGNNQCTPSNSCQLTLRVNVGNIVPNVDYYVNVTGISGTTSISHQANLLVLATGTTNDFCGNAICGPEETCNLCPLDCGMCPGGGSQGGTNETNGTSGGSGPSGGSSGGSSGGGGGSSRTTAPQCSDKVDNDGDGKVDYPEDLGCDSRIDNNEVDVQSIVTPGNYSLGESDIPGDQTSGGQGKSQFGLIYLIVLSVLLIGIIVAIIAIVHAIKRKKRIQSLGAMVEPGKLISNTYP